MNPILVMCFYVASVTSQSNLAGIDNNKFTFGVRQITEDILSNDGIVLCDSSSESASPVYVTITDIKAPTQGVRIGPFEFKQKITIVEVDVAIGSQVYHGVGKAKTNVAATLLQLQDENLPFERTEFSVALKKSLEDALIH
jgi:hypothetical protein